MPVLAAGALGLAAILPELRLHLYHYTNRSPTPTWDQFRDTLRPRYDTQHQHWANDANPQMTAAEAQHWLALVTTLDHLTTRAADSDQHLPPTMDAWRPWIIPVVRMSFPAGRIVGSLHQPRLTPPANGDKQ